MLTTSVAAGAVALFGILWILTRATRALGVVVARIDDLRLAVHHASVTLAKGGSDVPGAVIQEQNAKIDRLTLGWVDFLDRHERLARRIDGSKGGTPRHRPRDRDEEPEDHADDSEHVERGDGQRVLPLPEAVGGVPGPRRLEFAPLPAFRLNG